MIKKLSPFLFLIVSILYSGSTFAGSANLIVVSAEQNEFTDYDIILRSWSNGQWITQTVVSATEKQEIHPTLVQLPNGDILVAWTQFTGVTGTIRSRFYSAEHDNWEDPQSLMTPTASDIAPTLAVDDLGNIWLAYSGSGANSDIYVTGLKSSQWLPPVKVSKTDESPDIQPQFAYDSQSRLQIIWKGFHQGNYVNFASTLINGSWSAEKRWQQEKTSSSLAQFRDTTELSELSKFLPPGSQAVAWAVGGKRPSAIPITSDK